MSKHVLIPLAAAVLAPAALTVPSPARAQFWDGPVFDASMHSQAMLNTALTTLNNGMVERAARKQASKRGQTGTPAKPAPAPARVAEPRQGGTVAGSAYKPTAAVRQKLAGIMGAKAGQVSGKAQEAEMRNLVLSGEAVRQYEKVAPALGLRRNDAVDALTFYMLSQWGVANDHRTLFTPAQVSGARRQAEASFASVADQLGTDALRQEFGEMLIVQGAINSGVFESAVAAGDDAAAARYTAMARQGGAKIFGTDPTQIALTDDGFRRR